MMTFNVLAVVVVDVVRSFIVRAQPCARYLLSTVCCASPYVAGETPLYVAAFENKAETVEALLTAAAGDINKAGFLFVLSFTHSNYRICKVFIHVRLYIYCSTRSSCKDSEFASLVHDTSTCRDAFTIYRAVIGWSGANRERERSVSG